MTRRQFITKGAVASAGASLVLRADGKQLIPSVSRAFHVLVSSAPSYLINQNFEGTGYDNSETWTEAGSGTIDEDYSSSGLGMQGSQCLRLALTAQTGRATSPSFTGQTDVWAYALLRIVSLPSSGTINLLTLYNGTTSLGRITIASTGALAIRNGSTGGTTFGTNPSTGTTYHVWLRYTAGSGANGYSLGAYSTDGTRPTSGGTFAEHTNGNATLAATDINVGSIKSGAGNTTVEFIVDRVLVSTSEIGDNP